GFIRLFRTETHARLALTRCTGHELAAADESARIAALLREAFVRARRGVVPHRRLAGHQRVDFAVEQFAPTAGLQAAIRERTDAHAAQIGDLVAEAREHAADLAVHAFVDRERQLRRVDRAPVDEDARARRAALGQVHAFADLLHGV